MNRRSKLVERKKQIFKEQQICLGFFYDLLRSCFVCTPFTQTSCPLDRLLTVINKALCTHRTGLRPEKIAERQRILLNMLFWFFVVLFKLDFSCFFYGLDSVSERRSLDPRTKRSNGSFIRTWKKEQRERELKSTSRWQWIQDRKLLHRQFNFTQRNHNFFILFDFHFVFFYYVLLPFGDDHNIFISIDCGDIRNSLFLRFD